MFIRVSVASRIKPLIINTNQIVSIDEESQLVFMSNGQEFDLMLDSYKDVLAGLTKEKTVKNDDPDTELLDLFNVLHRLTGGKGNPVFSLTREKRLKELLGKHRMTKELLIKAATNIGKDEFLQGKNDSNKRYGDIDYLLRPDKAAKWAEDQTEKKKGMF